MTQTRQNAIPTQNGQRRVKPHKTSSQPQTVRLNGHAVCIDNEPPHEPSPLIYDLAPEDSRTFEDEARHCLYDPFDEHQLESFLREARIRFGNTPESLRRLLTNFAMDGNLDGFLLIRGFRQDPDLPPTPTTSCAAVRKESSWSEFYMATVGMALGEMVGYSQEKNGAFWQSINPTRNHESRQTSESSSILLTFHTEVMFHPHMPDYVLLYGLRQDPEYQAKTIIASIRRFYRLLPLRTRQILFQPLFKTGIDPSFGNEEALMGTGPVVSVLYGDLDDPFFRYDLDLMVGQTSEARAALHDLRRWVNKVKLELTIEPGSLLVVDNRRTVHARSSFQAHYDGRDRWLERVSVVKDLRPSLADRATGSRIIDTDFSAYLGK